MESKYMTLEEYAATLKVGDEVTIEYYSISGDRQTKEKILKITNYLFEVKMKAERIQQLKKAYIFYWRRIRTLLATGYYILTIDYRKKGYKQ